MTTTTTRLPIRMLVGGVDVAARTPVVRHVLERGGHGRPPGTGTVPVAAERTVAVPAAFAAVTACSRRRQGRAGG